MTTPLPPGDGESALTSDDEDVLFFDVEEHGDARDDPEYLRLLGRDRR